MAGPSEPVLLPAYQGDGATVYLGDAPEILARLPEHSVDCCVTLPPHWGLRDYHLPPAVWGGDPDCRHQWTHLGHDSRDASASHCSSNLAMVATRGSAADDGGRFCLLCGAWLDSLGMEATPVLYVEHLVDVFRQLRRVLKPTGTLWLNLGDTYAGSRSYQVADNKQPRVADRPRLAVPWGMKPKDLVGLPWRVAFALKADGWYRRSAVILAKPNPMPELVRDRPTRAHEYLFLLSIGRSYHYDADAVRELCVSGPSDIRKMVEGPAADWRQAQVPAGPALQGQRGHQHRAALVGRRSLWPQPALDLDRCHPALPRRPLRRVPGRAGRSLRACRDQRAWLRPPLRRAVGAGPEVGGLAARQQLRGRGGVALGRHRPLRRVGDDAGRGRRLGRNAVGIELNPDYFELIKDRLLHPTQDGASMPLARETKEAV